MERITAMTRTTSTSSADNTNSHTKSNEKLVKQKHIFFLNARYKLKCCRDIQEEIRNDLCTQFERKAWAQRKHIIPRKKQKINYVLKNEK